MDIRVLKGKSSCSIFGNFAQMGTTMAREIESSRRDAFN